MTQAEILDKIKRAEEEAANSIKNAEKNRETSLNKARIEREEFIKKAEETVEANRMNDISKAQNKIDKKKEKILVDGDTENDAMRKKASEKIKKAADTFISKFMESV
tara:strand:+ start:992 stop:1312 length:321 start_codon:yes stop_codon:yes gene_type:complete